MLDSVALYFGGLLLLAGAVAAIGQKSRRGAAFAGGGLFLIFAALFWPPSTKRAVSPATHLDEALPFWQFDERHDIHIDAPPARVFTAIRAVTANEIYLFRTLIAIRRLGRRLPVGILNAPPNEPLLDLATRTTFVWLANDPPRELVVGTTVAPDTFAVMNFLVMAGAGGGSNVSTETRVAGRTPAAARKFAVYWRIIHPGSDIIRRSWLRAVKRRAEAR